MPLLTLRSMICSSLPSSMPVNSACSDFLRTTLIFSIILAGRFWVAIWGSSRKKVFPPIVILEMDSPLEVTVPSSLTSMPGSFFKRSMSMSLSVVLNEDALYSTVSFFMVIGLPVAETLAASRVCLSSSILMLPRSRFPLTSISLEKAWYPSNSALKIYFPLATFSIATLPSAELRAYL